MAKLLPYYRWFTADAKGDEKYVVMSDTQRGFFHRCLDHSWDNLGLPSDLDEIAAVMSVTREYFDQVWERVGRCWHLDGDRLFNARQEKERTYATSKSSQATGAVRARYGRSTDVVRTNNGRNTDVIRTKDSRSTSEERRASVSVSVSKDLFFDAESSFQRLWEAYPAKGRVDFTLSQSYFCEEITDCATFEAALESVTAGKWAKSEKWSKGFIKAFPAWIHNRAWETEDPEPVGGQQSETVQSTMDPETARRIKAARRG